MADTVEGRREKKKPSTTKQDVAALRAAGVPRNVLAEMLSRDFKDVGAQRRAINSLIRRFGGTQAPQLANSRRR